MFPQCRRQLGWPNRMCIVVVLDPRQSSQCLHDESQRLSEIGDGPVRPNFADLLVCLDDVLAENSAVVFTMWRKSGALQAAVPVAVAFSDPVQCWSSSQGKRNMSSIWGLKAFCCNHWSQLSFLQTSPSTMPSLCQVSQVRKFLAPATKNPWARKTILEITYRLRGRYSTTM